jgi:NAD(P)-dependent dehydrogenase (short-subunit alcohol dehydrogenase family)
MRFPSVVVVTGASAGVGRAAVRRFAERGADVGLLDRYLGRNGYRSQQTDQPRDPHRPANLWTPVPGDHGAHGPLRRPGPSAQPAAVGHHPPRDGCRAGRRRARRARRPGSGAPVSRRPPLLHGVLGAALLAFPGAVLRRAGWSTGDRAGVLAVRVLGIRHLGQAVALWLWPGRSAPRRQHGGAGGGPVHGGEPWLRRPATG